MAIRMQHQFSSKMKSDSIIIIQPNGFALFSHLPVLLPLLLLLLLPRLSSFSSFRCCTGRIDQAATACVTVTSGKFDGMATGRRPCRSDPSAADKDPASVSAISRLRLAIPGPILHFPTHSIEEFVSSTGRQWTHRTSTDPGRSWAILSDPAGFFPDSFRFLFQGRHSNRLVNEEGGFWDLHDPAGSFFGGILIRGPPALGSPLGGGGG